MTKMTNACRLLADHIAHLELSEDLYGELKFLRTEMIEMLTAEDNQLELAADYALQQEQQEVQNPWLRELTDRFFN